jgi:hypothetical protein
VKEVKGWETVREWEMAGAAQERGQARGVAVLAVAATDL